MITIYSDGGNSAKNGVGAWAAVILKDNKVIKEMSQGYTSSPTNNMVELAAVIYSLEYVLNNKELGDEVLVISDSEYVVNGATKWLNGWKLKNWKSTTGDVKNRPLWEALDFFISNLNVKFEWVRGHSGDKWNEYVDNLAVKTYKQLLN